MTLLATRRSALAAAGPRPRPRASARGRRLDRRLLVYLELAYLFAVFFLVNDAGVPYAAVYALDAVNLLAFLSALGGCGGAFRGIGYGPVAAAFGALCYAVAASALVNAVDAPLVLWAFRNTFRFFGFFVACVVLLDMGDVGRILNAFFVLQVVNTAASLYQFFVLGLEQDSLGGVFGSGVGCNGFSNVFFCILLAYYSVFCLAGREPVWKLVFVCVSTLALAAMAELKFYFFEFVLIVLTASALYLHKARALFLTAAAGAALALGLYVLSMVFPSALETVVDLDEAASYASPGMATYKLGRLGAFSEINGLIFNGDPWKELLGVGFGGAEFSSNVALFTSDFYRVWGSLNYRWFSHQMWYIETGAVGFGLLVLLLVSHAVYSWTRAKSLPRHRESFRFVALVTAVTVINLWYNCTIRTEAAYMTFFVLSISCIAAKEGAGVSRLRRGAPGSSTRTRFVARGASSAPAGRTTATAGGQPSITQTFKSTTIGSFFRFFDLLERTAAEEPERFRDECRLRAARRVVDYSRALIGMVEGSSSGEAEKRRYAREVCGGEALARACGGYPFWRLPAGQAAFFLCLRFRLAGAALLLARMRARTR